MELDKENAPFARGAVPSDGITPAKGGAAPACARAISSGSLARTQGVLSQLLAGADDTSLALTVSIELRAPTPWRRLLEHEERLALAAPNKQAAKSRLLLFYSHATREMDSDEFSKHPDFALVWIAYARLQGERSELEARQTFKHLKNERIGVDCAELYLSWAAFERAYGQPAKEASVLELGRSRLGASFDARLQREEGGARAPGACAAEDDGGEDETVVFGKPFPDSHPDPASASPDWVRASPTKDPTPSAPPPLASATSAGANGQGAAPLAPAAVASRAALSAADEDEDMETVSFKPRLEAATPSSAARAEPSALGRSFHFGPPSTPLSAAQPAALATAQLLPVPTATPVPRKAFVRLGLRSGPARRVAPAPEEPSCSAEGDAPPTAAAEAATLLSAEPSRLLPPTPQPATPQPDTPRAAAPPQPPPAARPPTLQLREPIAPPAPPAQPASRPREAAAEARPSYSERSSPRTPFLLERPRADEPPRNEEEGTLPPTPTLESLGAILEESSGNGSTTGTSTGETGESTGHSTRLSNVSGHSLSLSRASVGSAGAHPARDSNTSERGGTTPFATGGGTFSHAALTNSLCAGGLVNPVLATPQPRTAGLAAFSRPTVLSFPPLGGASTPFAPAAGGGTPRFGASPHASARAAVVAPAVAEPAAQPQPQIQPQPRAAVPA
ncbi:hypothetical protein T492DRAFT_903867, partial [Pavlovales sp. CCMP2436]